MTHLCGEHSEAIKNLKALSDEHNKLLKAIDRKQWLIILGMVLLRASYTPEVINEVAKMYSYISKLTI